VSGGDAQSIWSVQVNLQRYYQQNIVMNRQPTNTYMTTRHAYGASATELLLGPEHLACASQPEKS
jgi:hypothetical protein